MESVLATHSTTTVGEGEGGGDSIRVAIHEPGDLPKADAFFSARTEIGSQAHRSGTVPSFARSEGFFHVVRRGAVLEHRAAPHNTASNEKPTPGPPARARFRLRVVMAFALVLLAAVVAVVVGLLVGPAHISAGEVVGALGRRLSGKVDVLRWRDTVVVGVRLPRVLVGFVAGGALAVAGAALQGLFRNPLAEPGVLGISSGASLGAVLAIYFHRRGAGGLAAARVRVRGRGGRRRAGVRDRGAPRAGARVHGDACCWSASR